MSKFDDFYRANYRRMVCYCTSMGFNEADVEEEVSTVIYDRYDEYIAKITGPAVDKIARSWMNRRVMLNLRSKYKKHENSKVRWIGEDESNILHFDDPESIVDLQQRVPHIPPILIRYESHNGNGPNRSTDKSYFCREKKKFLTALNQGMK